MHARFFVASFAVLLLAGCASMPNPFGTPSQASSTVGTAVPPPIVGAANANDPRVADLEKGGTNALKGPAIVTYMDQEEADLRAQLGSSGALITRAGQQIVLTLPANLAFDGDKAAVKPQFRSAVSTIGQLLKKYDKTVVDVYGYTDAQSPDQSDRDLSQRRAVAVAAVLTNQGVDQRRFFVEGRGAQNPVGSNDTEVGRAQNRRVEIQISPLIVPA
jgi:outer membrane protein OmpA-like peptidoglycan-associated protein